MMQKLLIIGGSTSTGKTEVGVHLAKKFDGEILSADSRQVYKGIDCISGKDTPTDVPLWLHDLVEIHESCSISLYAKEAKKAIEIITTRNKKLPIVVGGTGLYISSFIKPIDTIDVPRNDQLRSDLLRDTVTTLKQRLQKIDNEKYNAMNHSDKNNPRRLIRAIEVFEWNASHKQVLREFPKYDILFLGLKGDPSVQKERIKARVLKRIQTHALQEAKDLYGVIDASMPSYTTLGLSLLWQYIDKKLTKEELIERWTNEEYAYAKRQETWFRKEKNIIWFDRDDPHVMQSIEKLVQSWYTKIA